MGDQVLYFDMTTKTETSKLKTGKCTELQRILSQRNLPGLAGIGIDDEIEEVVAVEKKVGPSVSE